LRDLEEMMIERGLSVDHSTISRWVLRDPPELNKRVRREIHRAVDSAAETIDPLCYRPSGMSLPPSTACSWRCGGQGRSVRE